MPARDTLAFRVALPVDEIAERFAARPEVRPGGALVLERHESRLVVRYDRKRPPYEDYELMPQQLWIDLEDQGRDVYVKVRVVSRPSARGFGTAIGFALTNFAANVLTDLSDLRDIRQRRAQERKALLDLAAATLTPLEVGQERGPFRD
ncbi:MAG: hypothetical protein KDK70_14875 [Myxococcales bacterium]|nr:hypothetical protein [Myxococcales bacterium]